MWNRGSKKLIKNLKIKTVWDKTDVNKDIKYIVRATVNNIHALSSVQLYDKLENVFTYNNGSSQIIDTTKG